MAATNRSSFANFVTMLVLLIAARDEVPMMILIAWGLFHTTIIAMRMVYKKILSGVLETSSKKVIRHCLNKNVFLVALGGISWGAVTIIISVYADVTIQLLLLVLLVGLTAGAMATLSPVFHALIFFMIPTLGVEVITALFYNDMMHYLFSMIVGVYTLVVISASHSIYSHIRSANSYKNQLEELNSSLEERVTQEREKNLKQTRLMFQQSRHAQMGEMISMIAHQWRQPLTSLSANIANLEVDMMLGSCDSDIGLKSLQKMNLLTEHLSSTVDDFSGFFKEDKRLDELSLDALIEGSRKMIDSSLRAKNIEIILEFEATTKVKVIANELRQVILNLIKNSEDVLIEKEVKDPYICLRTFEVDHGVAFSIEDNGGGIEAAIIDNIFDAYFTTKGELNGTGLGLYMSKTIVQEHLHGEISVSNTAKGACFVVVLPKV